ncbi:hypothetical protein ACX8XP_09545 [Calditrichota bacterium LG25]
MKKDSSFLQGSTGWWFDRRTIRPFLKLFTPGKILLLWMFFFIASTTAHSQPLAPLKAYYESLEFEKTISYGQQLLKDASSFTPDELIEIHKYLGFAYFNLRKMDSARVQFLTILEIDPDYEFDPITTSPKIIAYYNALKKEFKQGRFNEKPAAIRYVFISDKRPAASLRSVFLPGWGQYYKGQKKRAALFFSSFLVASAATASAAILENHYHQKYRAVDDITKLDAAYDDYNRWYKFRKAGVIVTVGVWLSSVFDAMWSNYEIQSVRVSITTFDRQSITLSINF